MSGPRSQFAVAEDLLGVRGCHSISWRPCSRSSSNPPDAPGQSQAQSTPTDVGCPTKSNQRQSSPTPRMSGQLSYIKEWTAPRAPVPSPAFRVVLHHELRCRGPHFRQWTIFPPGGEGPNMPLPFPPNPPPNTNAQCRGGKGALLPPGPSPPACAKA